MRFCTIHDVPLRDLLAMARGSLEDTISDVDFLQTLAVHHCFLLPPYVMQARQTGGLLRITHLTYTIDGELDKARILVAVARRLRELRQLRGERFGGRLQGP
jgi:hypothetical protein